MSDDSDPFASMPRLPMPSLAEIDDARKRAERQPPVVTTIPQPEFVPGGRVRFSCPLDCGWRHDEAPGLEPAGPLRVPVNFTPEDLSAAVSKLANERAEQFRLRVETAMAAHFHSAHPEH